VPGAHDDADEQDKGQGQEPAHACASLATCFE
jgi:hypothetical protein